MSPRAGERFEGVRVLVTSANVYMGPTVTERFEAAGATVVADAGTYETDPVEPGRVVEAAGHVDVLVVNLLAAVRSHVEDIEEEDWRLMFARMVDPTMRYVKAVLPQMIERRAGKIVVLTSTAPLRALRPGMTGYTSARGAQNAFVLSAGTEVARHNIQINAIGQNYVYGGYARDALDDPDIREEVARDVPARRIAEPWEHAELVLFLASQNSNFLSAQVIPFAGGWAT